MPRYRVAFSDEAKAQLRAAMTWWRENRPKAPGLLGAEMRAAVGALREAPELGVACKGIRINGLRKMPLHRTRRMVYYLLDREAHTVMIVSIWGAVRGEGPPLR